MKIKRYINIVVLCLISIGIQAQVNSSPSTDKNYVHIIVPQSNQGISGPVIESITYVDGLGRTDQEIHVGASSNGKDLVQPVVYDEFGRESKKYLPYAGSLSTGAYYSNETQVSNWTQHYGSSQDDYAYSETVFENSPLNRVLAQGAPGLDWQPTYSSGNPTFSGHTVKLEYSTNTSTEVLNFNVDNITATNNGHYCANQLYKTVSKDENWTSGKAHSTEEFKDKQGQVVLKRSWLDDSTPLNTYYVYDDFGLLRYVLPPKAFESGSTTVTSTELTQLCYQYEYDHRNRMIKKQLPGAEPVYMLYDIRDRLVMTRDGNQKNTGQWMYTLYDELNRPKETGVCNAGSFASLKSMVNASSNYIPSGRTALTYTYYDDYSVSSGWGYPYTEPSGFSENIQASDVTGMVTATQTKNLESGVWLREVFYYDKYGRVLQSYKKNHLGGYDRITNLYDFTGTVTKTEQYHRRTSSSTPVTIVQRFEYDHAKRLTKAYHKIGSQAEVLMVENQYDELGQLIEKDIHNGIQSIDYRYNIRGWLTSINNSNLNNDGILNNDTGDLFGMELSYNEYVSGLGGTADEQFNGNISAVKWKNTSQSNIQAYLFSYDALNRLKKADYKYKSSSWVNSSAYDVYGNASGRIGYDMNGNITSLVRKNDSGTIIDNLTYTYTGNQLKAVEDLSGNDGFKELVSNSVEYQFDDNGNLIDDDNRGHVIQYNLLNLPKSLNGGALQYQYSATGEKLRKIFGSTTTDYIGNFVYVNNALAYIVTSEGRIVKPGTTYLYEYNLKDHLGNTRVSFQVDKVASVLQNQDYYPFGMAMNTIQNDNRYLYNGKELQDDVINGDNLDWYDYGARMYDAQIGRWHVIDKMAQSYDAHSTYAYALNNPINAIDPDGQLVIFVNGFMKDQWMKQDNRQSIVSFHDAGSKSMMNNPSYRPYPPSRNFTSGAPSYLGQSFAYWGNETNTRAGAGGVISQAYNDYNSLYVSASADNTSQAKDRYNEGAAAAADLISKLDNGDISLEDGETIKIVGHSQGAAFAAGMASVLAKNQKYSAILEAVHYIAPHQPGGFTHPSNIEGHQWSTKSDLVSSWSGLGWLKGDSKFEKIDGIKDDNFHWRDSYSGLSNFRGHLVNTYLDMMVNYFRSLGIPVTVVE